MHNFSFIAHLLTTNIYANIVEILNSHEHYGKNTHENDKSIVLYEIDYLYGHKLLLL